MAPFSLPRGIERRVETKQGHLTNRVSLIGGGTDNAKGRTGGGELIHQSETTYRQRTITNGGKVSVAHDGKRDGITSKKSKGGVEGGNTNQDDKGDSNNNEADGKTRCSKFNIFCRGNRTSGNGKDNNGDGSDKGDGKDKDREEGGGNSSSRPTNKPESTTIISTTPGSTSLALVSESTQAPTLSLLPELSATSMGPTSLSIPPSFTTSYVQQATSSGQAISPSQVRCASLTWYHLHFHLTNSKTRPLLP